MTEYRMSEVDAIAEFEQYILPQIQEMYEQDGIVDYIARREAWNDWTDGLCKDGYITVEQYETWDNPY
jgi:hypothetical protein